MKPNVFIGSSSESLDAAHAIQQALERDCACTVWDQGVFELGDGVLDSLIKELDRTDFGIFVFMGDDLVTIREERRHSTRDNVVLEFGLFIGRLGKNRTFFVLPRNRNDFRLPSDLTGIVPAEFDDRRENLQAALGPACNRMRSTIVKYGIRPERREDLEKFLGLPRAGGDIGVYVPRTEAVHHAPESEPYKVRSVALSDVRAVVEIVSLLGNLNIGRRVRSFQPGELFIHESAVAAYRGSTLFLVGGPLPNAFVRNILQTNDFNISFEDLGQKICITCPGFRQDAFAISPPRGDTTIEEAERQDTFGCVMKIRRGARTTFVVWGLDERGTEGAGAWLASSWEIARGHYEDEDFAAIIRFPPDHTFSPEEVVLDQDRNVLVPVSARSVSQT